MNICKISLVFRNITNRKDNLRIYKLLSTQAAAKSNLNHEHGLDTQNQWSSAKSYDEIPGPTKLQFMRWFLRGGKLHNKPLREFHRMLNAEYGDILKVPGLFGKNDIVFTYQPGDFEKVFRTEGTWPVRPGLESLQHYRKEVRNDVFGDAEGLTTTNGEEWANFRSIANPVLMQPKTIKIYVPRMDNVASDFIEKIRSLRDPSTLEVTDDFFDHISNWTLESICVVALDTKLNLITDPSKHPDAMELKASLKIFFDMLYELDFKPSLWKVFATPNYKKFIESMNTITKIAKKYVDEATKNLNFDKYDEKNINERSVLERLSMIDKKFAITMAMDLLVAGVDTTASAFTACLTGLAKSPEKQEILREEIMKILPEKNTPLTDENMKHLPYLRACIKEALRVYPVTMGNIRSSAQDIVLGGYRIPKNTDIFMAFALLFQNDEEFTESMKFIPERWLRKSAQTEIGKCPFSDAGERKSSNPFTYLPFGFGPRMCIGKRLVDMELEIALSKIVRNFKVEFNYPDDNLFRQNVINIPNVPLKYKFIDID